MVIRCATAFLIGGLLVISIIALIWGWPWNWTEDFGRGWATLLSLGTGMFAAIAAFDGDE